MFAVFLGLVQGQVRQVVQPLKLQALPRQVQPHAGGEGQGLLRAQDQLQLAADLGGLGPDQVQGDAAVEEHRELVAPQPAHNVPGVEEVGEDLPRLADGLVPGLVAQGVVDPLEVV